MTLSKNQATTDTEKENGWFARSRITRQKLISTAFKLIAQKGVKSLSVAAVAREAGITRPGAYYHFSDRDALLEAVRNETDRQLVRTVAGSKTDENLYTQAADLTAADEDMVFLRIQRMLDQGCDDLIISSRQRGIERLEREGHLQADVYADMAAIISSTTLISSFLVIREFKQKNQKHKQAKIYGKNIHDLLWYGALKEKLLKNWKDAFELFPTYSPTEKEPQNRPISELTEPTDARRIKSKETRKLLMDAAMELMAEVGEEAVSVSEVARRAGVTRPGTYYHFKKKEDLIAAVEEKLDKELLYTLDRSFVTRESFEGAADISTEDLSLLRIRIQRMLKNGVSQDPLIDHYKNLFNWHHDNGYLKEGRDTDMAAVITATASLVGLYLVISQADSIEDRQALAKRYRKTFKSFVFNGLFNPEIEKLWPSAPTPE